MSKMKGGGGSDQIHTEYFTLQAHTSLAELIPCRGCFLLCVIVRVSVRVWQKYIYIYRGVHMVRVRIRVRVNG